MRNKAKKMGSVALAVALATTNVSAFTDIEGHWAEETLIKWSEQGLINGFLDGTLKPDGSITRAEFVKIITNSMALTQLSEISFTDINEDDWFYEAVSIAVAYGITNGMPDGRFAPNEIVTRAQAAVFMSNALGVTGGSVEQYTDFEDIPSWAVDAVGAMSEIGFLNGNPDGTFASNQALTRAEAISFIDRIVESDYRPIEPNIQSEEVEGEILSEDIEEDTSQSTGSSSSGSSSSGSSSSGSSDNAYDETEELPEDDGETEELPEDDSETEELPEDDGETEELPEYDGETEELPEDDGETEELQEDDGEIEELPEDDGETEELPEDDGETEELPEDDGETEELPEDNGETEELPEDNILDYSNIDSLIYKYEQVIENKKMYDESTDLWYEFMNLLDYYNNLLEEDSLTQSIIDETAENINEYLLNIESVLLKFDKINDIFDIIEEILENSYKYDISSKEWNDFIDTYTSAKEEIQLEYLTQNVINSYVVILEDNISYLNEILLDFTELEILIQKAEEDFINKTENYDTNSKLWSDFIDIYEEIKDVIELKSNMTSEALISICKSLEEAMYILENASVTINNAYLLNEEEINVDFIATLDASVKILVSISSEKPNVSEFSSLDEYKGTGNEANATLTLTTEQINADKIYVYAVVNDDITDGFEIDLSSDIDYEVCEIEIFAIGSTNLTKGSPLEYDDGSIAEIDKVLFTDIENVDSENLSLVDEEEDYYTGGFDTSVYPDTEDKFTYQSYANTEDTLIYQVNLINKRGEIISKDVEVEIETFEEIDGEVVSVTKTINIYDQIIWTIIDENVIIIEDLDNQQVTLKALNSGVTNLIVNYVDWTGYKSGVLSQFVEITIK